MTDEMQTLLDRRLREAIRRLPEKEPPPDFTARVMADLEPKSVSAWTRFRMWLSRPMQITVTPARLAPVLACAMALLLVGGWFGMRAAPPTAPIMQTATLPVTFVLRQSAPEVRSVAVIGSFNDWNADGYEMLYDASGKAWVLRAQLPPGDHEYVFLVNGDRVMPDPGAALTRNDGFGNRNSVLFVNPTNGQTL